MAKREKFGKFVLLEEVDSSGLGAEYRAAKLSATGLEKIVALLRLGPELSRNGEFAKNLMDQAKLAAQLQNANVTKIFGIGKVEAAYYISYEFVEGKSLKGIFARCRRDGFPFSVDHTLLIASKLCSALEYAHGRKTDAGVRYCHGLVNPGNVFVSYEGEVRVRGFGYWPSKVREAGALREDELVYLSPEQSAGGAGDTRSDTFAVGAILFETLTGQPLLQGARAADIPARLAAAKLQSPTGEDDSIPKPIADILAKALAVDPAGRYAELGEMRKAIDTLLFSGDFTPTTFNLAFFMHSLFREDIDKESKQLKDEKEASYLEFLTDETAKPAPKTAPGVSTLTPVPGASAPRAEPVHVHATPAPAATSHSAASHEPPPAPAATAKEAAAGFTFHKDEAKKSNTPMLAGGVGLLLLLAAGGYYFFGRGPGAPVNTAPPTTTLSAEAIAAQAHVRELEEKLKAFEAEKAAAEEKAAEEAKKKLEAQAKALGTTADPAAIAKAQEEAAKKARLDQEKKQQEEKKRLEDAKAAEEQRLAEEQRKAEEARLAAAAAATTTLPPTTTVPPTTQAALKPGTLVNLSDTGVTPPVPDKTPPLVYPPIALRQRIEGTVELSILVDEKGVVTDTQVVTSAGGRSGLDEAAAENAKKRKYRPATKDGIPVKVWMPLRVQFKLPS